MINRIAANEITVITAYTIKT